MSRDRGYVREIDWMEVLPWLGLARAIALAWAPSKLLLALLGLTLTAAGWSSISGLYAQYGPDDEDIKQQAEAYRRAEPWHQKAPVDVASLTKTEGMSGFIDAGASAGQSLARLPAWYTQPFWQMFARDIHGPGFSLAVLCALWVMAVWAFCGGAITRLAAVRLAQDRRIGLVQACRHAIGKWLSYFSGPLFPLGGLLLFLLVASIAGGVSRLDLGFVLVGALWPIGMIFALICGVLLVAALFGWPLMWSAVSTESSDAFDSFNRSFSYVTQRPFHLAFYVLVAGLMGAAAWLFVATIGELTIYLTAWGVSWGSGAKRAGEIFTAAAAPMTTGTADLTLGGRIVARWNDLLRLLVLAYGHSFLWTAASGIYLLLRRDTDATPLDEVYLESAEDPYGLPPVRRDAAGVTVLDESQTQPVGTAKP